MAQHQTIKLGDHGPVFTEHLANYEKVSFAPVQDEMLKMTGQLYSSTSTLSFFGT
jgi:hypothetical protein